MKKRNCVFTFAAALFAVFVAFAEDDDNSGDPGKIGDAASVIGNVFGNSDEKKAIIKKVSQQNQQDYENRKSVDDKMSAEAQNKVDAAKTGQSQAKHGYAQSIEKYNNAVKNQNLAGADLRNKEKVRWQAEQKFLDNKQRYDNAVKAKDPNAGKYLKDLEQSKTNLQNAKNDVVKATEKFNNTKTETKVAQDSMNKSKATLNEANKKVIETQKQKEFVDKNSTTKDGKPVRIDERSTLDKAVEITQAVTTAASLGGEVYDLHEAIKSGDTEAQWNASTAITEDLVLTTAGVTPGAGAVVAGAYTTAKTIVKATDAAADSARAESETKDSFNNAKTFQIATDIMSASRGEDGKPTISADMALHIAEGYVYGYGGEDSKDYVENLYNSGKVVDKNGNVKGMPKDEELAKMTIGDIMKNCCTGVKESFQGLAEGAAKGVIVAGELAKELGDSLKAMGESGVILETILQTTPTPS